MLRQNRSKIDFSRKCFQKVEIQIQSMEISPHILLINKEGKGDSNMCKFQPIVYKGFCVCLLVSFVLFCFVLFCSVLFCFVLFCYVLFFKMVT